VLRPSISRSVQPPTPRTTVTCLGRFSGILYLAKLDNNGNVKRNIDDQLRRVNTAQVILKHITGAETVQIYKVMEMQWPRPSFHPTSYSSTCDSFT